MLWLRDSLFERLSSRLRLSKTHVGCLKDISGLDWAPLNGSFGGAVGLKKLEDYNLLHYTHSSPHIRPITILYMGLIAKHYSFKVLVAHPVEAHYYAVGKSLSLQYLGIQWDGHIALFFSRKCLLRTPLKPIPILL